MLAGHQDGVGTHADVHLLAHRNQPGVTGERVPHCGQGDKDKKVYERVRKARIDQIWQHDQDH